MVTHSIPPPKTRKITYQNSGVRIKAVDNEEEKIAYYGQIEDI